MLLCFAAFAEESAIPVVSLNGESLDNYTEWTDKDTYHPATLSYTFEDQSFTKDIEIKPQGTTSLYAPKKNFTIKFSEKISFVDQWGAQDKYVLKADYIDPTRSCNVVSAKLAAEMNEKYGVLTDTPNHGAIDGFPIWVKINGEDCGIFNLTIPKDAWLLNMDSANPNHMILACEGWTDACNFISTDIDFETDWTFEVGEPTDENKAAFKRLAEFIANSDDKTFVENFDQYLDLDACLNYICFVNAAYASDNVSKNMLLATYDGKVWYPILYDLDSLWGVKYDGMAPAEADGQWGRMLITDINRLHYRINRLFKEQVNQRYWELREGILSKEHVIESFKEYAGRIPAEYVEIDQNRWNADGAYIRTVELMSELMDTYLPAVDQYFTLDADDSAIDGTANEENAKVRYVWEENGVYSANENIDQIPAGMTMIYTLNGAEISSADLEGKSGSLIATMRVERNANADSVLGVVALMNVEQAKCNNVSVKGGTLANVKDDYVFTGATILGGTQNIFEMQMSMDVTDFDPADYMVVVTPLYVDAGGAGDLDTILSIAGELTAIMDEGLLIHEKMVELHAYLTNIGGGITALKTSDVDQEPSDENVSQDAGSVITGLLADAEADCDEMLKELGYAVEEAFTTSDRVRMLNEVKVDPERTLDEQNQASELLDLIEKYSLVAGHVEKTDITLKEIDETLELFEQYMPEITGAYDYMNDYLYAVLYRIFTLKENTLNYYASKNGGYAANFDDFVNGYNVVVFSNHDLIYAD